MGVHSGMEFQLYPLTIERILITVRLCYLSFSIRSHLTDLIFPSFVGALLPGFVSFLILSMIICLKNFLVLSEQAAFVLTISEEASVIPYYSA